MVDLILPLNAFYFDEIKRGNKVEEYRLDNEYWQKRLIGKTFERVVLTKGYPRKDDHERRIIRAWRGFTRKTITHPHFGNVPTKVFAIDIFQSPSK